MAGGKYARQKLITVYSVAVSPKAGMRPTSVDSDMRGRLGNPVPILLSGEPWPSRVHFDDVDTVRGALAVLQETGEFRATYRAYTEDGGYVWLRDRLSFADPARHESPARIGIGYVTASGSELAVDHEADTNEIFTAALTHELGQILSTIGFTAETLPSLAADANDETALTDALSDKADRIRDSARRAKRVIRGLHDIFRNEGVFVDPVDVRRVVESALSHFSPGHVPVHLSVPDRLVVQGNAVLLELAVTNLLKNASEAILRQSWGALEDSSHRIDIDACHTMDWIELKIRDTGGGMTGNTESAFSRHVTSKRDKALHGIGLWLVRRVAEHHDGKVTLRNTGRGLEVSLTLPRLLLGRGG